MARDFQAGQGRRAVVKWHRKMKGKKQSVGSVKHPSWDGLPFSGVEMSDKPLGGKANVAWIR